jgi:diguanylate cyclase (GGDEF)-like protein
LAIGLGVALLVVFSRPIAQLFDYVHEVEDSHGVRLLPALAILAALFGFHQYRKQQELRAEALGASAATREATERAEDMARLVAFGHALARFPDEESIRAAAAAHIPLLAPYRRAWVMTRNRGQWEALITVGETPLVDREQASRRAMGEADVQPSNPHDDVCFPMVIADQPVCVLGVASEPALSDHQRSVLTTAVALLATSLKNVELFHDVRENSLQDGLTGCFNRTHALESLDAELRRARRANKPFSLLMFDLDHFKSINDRYGHLCGDAVLSAVGVRMKAALRSSDLKCRYGGEEFFVLLPDTPLAGARRVCETLRLAISKDPVPWSDGNVSVTASFGVTEILPGETDPLAIVARTDSALYRAKQQGRNCVCVAEQPALARA